MTTKQVADRLVALCRQGQFETAMQDLYSPNILSVEPDGAPIKESNGIEEVMAKAQQWSNMVEEVHSMEVSDPLVADKFFSCTMKMDVTYKGAPRSTMEEVCLYKVDNGKIVREEFFFTPMPQG